MSFKKTTRLGHRISSTFYSYLQKKENMPKYLSKIIIFGCLFTFILSFVTKIFPFVAGLMSLLALGFVLYSAIYTSPSAIKKRITIEQWQLISVCIVSGIIILLLFIFFGSYPSFEIKSFVSDWAGNIATIFGLLFSAVLYLCERRKLENWWKKNSVKVLWTIIIMVFLSIGYIQFFIIAGKVSYSDDKEEKVKNAKIALLRESSFLSDFLCYNILQDKDLYKLKDENDFFYKWVIKDNKLCETTTDDDGNFSFRVFSFSKEKIKKFDVNGKEIEPDKPIKRGLIGDKNIEFSILKKPLEGSWSCGNYGKVEVTQNEDTIILNPEKPICELSGKITLKKEKDFSYSFDDKNSNITAILNETNELELTCHKGFSSPATDKCKRK